MCFCIHNLLTVRKKYADHEREIAVRCAGCIRNDYKIVRNIRKLKVVFRVVLGIFSRVIGNYYSLHHMPLMPWQWIQIKSNKSSLDSTPRCLVDYQITLFLWINMEVRENEKVKGTNEMCWKTAAAAAVKHFKVIFLLKSIIAVYVVPHLLPL